MEVIAALLAMKNYGKQDGAGLRKMSRMEAFEVLNETLKTLTKLRNAFSSFEAGHKVAFFKRARNFGRNQRRNETERRANFFDKIGYNFSRLRK